MPISTTCPVPFRCLWGSSAGPVRPWPKPLGSGSSTVTSSALKALWNSCPYSARYFSEAPEAKLGSIRLPQAALTRADRVLEASAEIVTAGGAVGPELPTETGAHLARALIADAGSLRSLVSEHGTSAGPTPDS